MTQFLNLLCLLLVSVQVCIANTITNARQRQTQTQTQTEMLVSDRCPDNVTTCYNGSKCMLIDDSKFKIPDVDDGDGNSKREYRCDCSQDVTDSIHHYAGYGCEFAAKEYCFLGKQYDGKSFCTDNGDCTEVWQPESEEEAIHKGCLCNDGYEGDFCEYELGSAPVPVEKNRGLGVFFVILIPSVAAAVVSGLFIKRRMAKKVQEESAPPQTVVNNDTDII